MEPKLYWDLDCTIAVIGLPELAAPLDPPYIRKDPVDEDKVIEIILPT
jgi:hypothetical protein